MYNYSVIIPHKNCVNLLFRCLDSIPRRKDIQVIVVDDVSSFSKGEKQQLLDKQDSNIKIVFLEKTHFAGGARNEGISLSEGKWLVFADSDDFFTKGAFDVMDQYLMSESDIVFFGDTSCYSDTLEPTNRYGQRMKMLEDFCRYKSEESSEFLRFKNPTPTCKMIKRDLVYLNKIRFDEVRASNDDMFSLLTGFFAKSIDADVRPTYCGTIRRGSLMQTKSKEIQFCRYEVNVRKYIFFREHNLDRHYPWLTAEIFRALYSFGFKEFFRYIKLARENHLNIWLGITRRFTKKKK